MPIQELHTFPQFSKVSATMQLGPVKLRYRLTWRERTKSWYIGLYELNDTPLLVGRRLSPFWSPLYGNATIPELIQGLLFVRGVEGYSQKDIGTEALLLWYIPFEDFAFFEQNSTEPLLTTTILAP